MKRFKLVLLGIMLTAAGLLSCGKMEGSPSMEGITEQVRTDTAMGTVIQQTVYLKSNEETKQAGEAQQAGEMQQAGEAQQIPARICEMITVLEEEILSRRLPSSEIFKINNRLTDQVSAKLEGWLTKIEEVSARSEGALDITLGEVVKLWDIDSWSVESEEGKEAYMLPEQAEIERWLSYCGYEKVVLKEGSLTLPEKVMLDLGGVGKGIACDEIAEFLANQEDVTGAVISVGGSVLTFGNKPGGSPWKVGVVHPREEGQYLGTLNLRGTWFVSTSGDYERFLEVEGKRYHHIIDPANGYPADNGVVSATVLGNNGLLCDALSTVCIVAGVEKGLEIVESFGAEALLVDTEGKVHMTEGMEKVWEQW